MKWLTDILSYWKTITGVILSTVALLTLAYTAGTKAERKQVQQTELSDGFKHLRVRMDTMALEQSLFYSTILEDISKISASVNEQAADIAEIKASQSNLKNYMINKAATKNDLLEILTIFGEQKVKATQIEATAIDTPYQPVIIVKKK